MTLYLFILFSSLAGFLVFFLIISRKTGLFGFPVFTFIPRLFIGIPASIGFFIGAFDGKGIPADVYLLTPGHYIFLYLFYLLEAILSFLALALCYSNATKQPLKTFLFVPTDTTNYKILLIVFGALNFSILFFLHAKFGFAYLTHPRGLYEVTRQGFGPFFFILGMVQKLFFILLLFGKYNNWLSICLMFVSAYGTGSKYNLFGIFMLWFIYLLIFRFNNRLSPKAVIGFAVVGVGFIYGIFAMTFGTNSNFLLLIMGYANEPFNNMVLLMDTFKHTFRDYFYGNIYLENNIFTRIPRFLMPDKPLIFGSFKLSDAYFYEHTALGVGAKSFGTLGDFFADLGYFAFPFYLIKSMIMQGALGYLLGRILKIGDRTKSLFYFMFLMVFWDISFIAVPPGNNFLENVLIVMGLAAFLGLHRAKVKETASI